MPLSRRYAITAAISLPRRKRASIRCLAASDSEPRTWNVSLSSAASSWSGPWSGAKATASTSQSPITAQREPRLAVIAARRASAVTNRERSREGCRRPEAAGSSLDPCYGVVVDSENVNVLAYSPERSTSVLLIC